MSFQGEFFALVVVPAGIGQKKETLPSFVRLVKFHQSRPISLMKDMSWWSYCGALQGCNHVTGPQDCWTFWGIRVACLLYTANTSTKKNNNRLWQNHIASTLYGSGLQQTNSKTTSKSPFRSRSKTLLIRGRFALGIADRDARNLRKTFARMTLGVQGALRILEIWQRSLRSVNAGESQLGILDSLLLNDYCLMMLWCCF